MESLERLKDWSCTLFIRPRSVVELTQMTNLHVWNGAITDWTIEGYADLVLLLPIQFQTRRLFCKARTCEFPVVVSFTPLGIVARYAVSSSPPAGAAEYIRTVLAVPDPLPSQFLLSPLPPSHILHPRDRDPLPSSTPTMPAPVAPFFWSEIAAAPFSRPLHFQVPCPVSLDRLFT